MSHELFDPRNCFRKLTPCCCTFIKKLRGSSLKLQCLRGRCLSSQQLSQHCIFIKKPLESLLKLQCLRGSCSSTQDEESCTFIKKLQRLMLKLHCLRGSCFSSQELPGGQEDNASSSDFGSLSSLQTLDLSYCETINELPRSIPNLQALKQLIMVGCLSLKRLPKDFGSLSSLEKLDLSSCSSIEELPESISKLQSLIDLNMSNCSSLKGLPENFGSVDGSLTALQTLDLSYCLSIKELSRSLPKLPSLRELNMVGCLRLQRLPEGFDSSSILQTLNLSYCSSIQELPTSLTEVRSLSLLRVDGCSSLKNYPKEKFVKSELSSCYFTQQST